jgi:enoyl-CoA hydratase/carnithine racemase
MSTATRAETDAAILLRDDRNGVATLTLNRPRQMNALSEALIDALRAQLSGIAADTSVRVVVIAGAGEAFSAGHDVKEMRSTPDAAYHRRLFKSCSRLMIDLLRLPQPAIARVHGTAAAAGCQLVAACDLAVASRSARFAVSGIDLGLFCSTPSVALARNVSRKAAFEMLVTGQFIDAETACERGLVNRVVDAAELDREVASLCDAIGSKSAAAVRIGKQMFYRQVEQPLETAYAYATEVMAANMMTEDAGEGIDAFIEKRAPRWRHR